MGCNSRTARARRRQMRGGRPAASNGGREPARVCTRTHTLCARLPPTSPPLPTMSPISFVHSFRSVSPSLERSHSFSPPSLDFVAHHERVKRASRGETRRFPVLSLTQHRANFSNRNAKGGRAAGLRMQAGRRREGEATRRCRASQSNEFLLRVDSRGRTRCGIAKDHKQRMLHSWRQKFFLARPP